MRHPRGLGSRLRVLVLGWLIRGPTGGIAWQYLNYVLGLAELGHDVYYVEDSGDDAICGDATLSHWGSDPTYGLRFASDAFARLGLSERWAYFDAHTNEWKGARAGDARELCQTADLAVHIGGSNQLRDWFERIPMRGLVDVDPGFTQVRNLRDPAFRQRSQAHTVFFSTGENIGKPSCLIPDDGFSWLPTRQPVSLAAWPAVAGPRNGRYTTVMQWESLPVHEYRGLRLGMKSESFPQFAQLPKRLGDIFEIAVRGKAQPLASLREAGWRIGDIDAVCRDPWTYQSFIKASKAEFGIAKQGYAATQSGWFGDRSAAYLASGRPVLAQHTGFSEWLPCGEGVVAFSSAEEVIAGVARINGDYEMHCRRARAIAEEFFDAKAVLSALIERA